MNTDKDVGPKGHRRSQYGGVRKLKGRRESEPRDWEVKEGAQRTAETRFQGSLASLSGGMFSLESQVSVSPLATGAVWKVQMGPQALAY